MEDTTEKTQNYEPFCQYKGNAKLIETMDSSFVGFTAFEETGDGKVALSIIGDLELQLPYCSKFGPVYSVKVIRGRYSNESKGFRLITYYNQKDGITIYIYFSTKFKYAIINVLKSRSCTKSTR